MVTEVPAEIVEPLLQLQPANVYPDRVSPAPLPVTNVAPATRADCVGTVPEPPPAVYVTENVGVDDH